MKRITSLFFLFLIASIDVFPCARKAESAVTQIDFTPFGKPGALDLYQILQDGGLSRAWSATIAFYANDCESDLIVFLEKYIYPETNKITSKLENVFCTRAPIDLDAIISKCADAGRFSTKAVNGHFLSGLPAYMQNFIKSKEINILEFLCCVGYLDTMNSIFDQGVFQVNPFSLIEAAIAGQQHNVLAALQEWYSQFFKYNELYDELVSKGERHIWAIALTDFVLGKQYIFKRRIESIALEEVIQQSKTFSIDALRLCGLTKAQYEFLEPLVGDSISVFEFLSYTGNLEAVKFICKQGKDAIDSSVPTALAIYGGQWFVLKHFVDGYSASLEQHKSYFLKLAEDGVDKDSSTNRMDILNYLRQLWPIDEPAAKRQKIQTVNASV